MSTRNEEEECEAAERSSAGKIWAHTQHHLTTHTRAPTNIYTRRKVPFLCCGLIALDQIRDVRCQGTKHVGVRA